MTDAATRLALAEAQAEAARARLSSTLTSLQARLDPKLLARDVKVQSRAVAKAGVNATIRNPGPVAGATALVGLFLVRHRIARLFRRNPPPITIVEGLNAPTPEGSGDDRYQAHR